MRILTEQHRIFHYSPLLKLEVTLLAEYHRNQLELQFYNEYFRNATCFGDLNRIFEIGDKEARRYGISVMDAMHIAAASLSRCEVFITGEKPLKPMYRSKLVKVVHFRAIT